MKRFVRLFVPFALGVIVTLVVVLPEWGTKPVAAQPTPEIDIQAEIKAAVDAAVQEALDNAAMMAQPLEAPAEQDPEPVEVVQPSEPDEPAQGTADEPTEAPAPTPMPEPVVTPRPAPAPKPSPPALEYFYEDGKKYAIINGHKTLIADDDEPSVTQEDFYDWENDPDKHLPGGFN
jgi:outer membrane biosynthesis protein TonB